LTLFFPARAPIDAYGDGGFRFAHLSHRGSLMILPSGMHAWDEANAQELTAASFDAAFAEKSAMDFFLLGSGGGIVRPARPVRDAFERNGLALDVMDTGAVIRTYNMLLAEKRAVGVALIAVGSAP
jgi:uncharacterized protein